MCVYIYKIYMYNNKSISQKNLREDLCNVSEGSSNGASYSVVAEMGVIHMECSGLSFNMYP